MHQDLLRKFEVIKTGASPADSDSPGMVPGYERLSKSSRHNPEVHTAHIDGHGRLSRWVPKGHLLKAMFFFLNDLFAKVHSLILYDF